MHGSPVDFSTVDAEIGPDACIDMRQEESLTGRNVSEESLKHVLEPPSGVVLRLLTKSRSEIFF